LGETWQIETWQINAGAAASGRARSGTVRKDSGEDTYDMAGAVFYRSGFTRVVLSTTSSHFHSKRKE
jgi:hypothetical protein